MSLRHAVALLRTRGGALGLLRDDQIIIVAATGTAEFLVGAPIPVHASITGRAILEHRAIICNDANVAEAYAPTRIAANVERTLVAPLLSGEGVLGALSVVDGVEPFTEDDALVLQRLADQVAVAVANARLYEEAHTVAERHRQTSEDERRARDAVAQSEARYRNLFETATDAIYTLDVHGSFTSVNEATCQMAGRSRDDLLGRSPLPLVVPSDVAAIKEVFKSALAGSARRYECRFVRPDGSHRLASVTNTPIRHGSQVIGILGVARDITDEREQALALERSETRYTRLVESASDAIFTVDPSGHDDRGQSLARAGEWPKRAPSLLGTRVRGARRLARPCALAQQALDGDVRRAAAARRAPLPVGATASSDSARSRSRRSARATESSPARSASCAT